ncbi:hypothetical protein Trydic_g11565 [Trypoxylus dichotomus]
MVRRLIGRSSLPNSKPAIDLALENRSFSCIRFSATFLYPSSACLTTAHDSGLVPDKAICNFPERETTFLEGNNSISVEFTQLTVISTLSHSRHNQAHKAR